MQLLGIDGPRGRAQDLRPAYFQAATVLEGFAPCGERQPLGVFKRAQRFIIAQMGRRDGRDHHGVALLTGECILQQPGQHRVSEGKSLGRGALTHGIENVAQV